MILMLCYECKLWGPHACMYVMCIEILPHYVMLVWTRTFDIYVRHDIMRVFFFCGVSRRHTALCLTS